MDAPRRPKTGRLWLFQRRYNLMDRLKNGLNLLVTILEMLLQL